MENESGVDVEVTYDLAKVDPPVQFWYSAGSNPVYRTILKPL